MRGGFACVVWDLHNVHDHRTRTLHVAFLPVTQDSLWLPVPLPVLRLLGLQTYACCIRAAAVLLCAAFTVCGGNFCHDAGRHIVQCALPAHQQSHYKLAAMRRTHVHIRDTRKHLIHYKASSTTGILLYPLNSNRRLAHALV